VAGLSIARSFVGTRTTLSLDGRRVRARVLLVLVSNAQLYAGALRVATNARLDDGLLDVCLFKGQGFLAILHHLTGVLVSRHLRDPEVEYHQARQVTIRSRRPLPVQVDGEPVGVTPMTFAVAPQALSVLVPRGGLRNLCSQ